MQAPDRAATENRDASAYNECGRSNMHAHDHTHEHVHAPGSFGGAFRLGITLNLIYVAAEAGAGLYLGSLALLADAGHNLSDVAGLALSWLGAGLAGLPPTQGRSYGLRRATILAALGNAVLLLVAVGAIALEAVERLRDPQPVQGMIVLAVAGVGLFVNTGTAMLFWRGRKHDLNIRSAFLHMAADALVTAGVIVAALLMMWTGWLWLDAAVAIVIAVVILIGTWGLLRDSVNMALDAVPDGIDPAEVQRWLESLPDVREVHDLHIWPLSTTDTALTAHLVRDNDATDDEVLLLRACQELPARFGIGHITIQIERDAAAGACGQRAADSL